MNIREIQKHLRTFGLNGWLLCDFRAREPFSYMVLGLNVHPLASRRWFYFIPAIGAPTKLMSRVEPHRISALKGKTRYYTTWRELHRELGALLGRGRKRVAMQYSPKNALPYVSTVDAGTIELVRSLGHTVVSSKDLLTATIGRMTPRGESLLRRAATMVDAVRRGAFEQIRRSLHMNGSLTEYDVQQWILREFADSGLTTSSPPMVGVRDHPSNPHFETKPRRSSRFRRGSPLLIDLWAKVDHPEGIYFDSTWVCHIGSFPDSSYARAFETVRDARDAAIEHAIRELEAGRRCRGCDLDRIARRVVERAGYGKYFIHRTGHSITTSTHGEGVNIDDFETQDDRILLPRSCFSIEPGIYIPRAFGVRSETTVAITERNRVHVLGELQRELVIID